VSDVALGLLVIVEIEKKRFECENKHCSGRTLYKVTWPLLEFPRLSSERVIDITQSKQIIVSIFKNFFYCNVWVYPKK
jgi:hypothetical protein